MNAIVETYSRLADQYDDEKNLSSCWGRSADQALAAIRLQDHHRVVVDVGCGTGRALARLARRNGPDRRFVGVEPAANMRKHAEEVTKGHGNIDIVGGSFEDLPMKAASVDYLYSIHAFHWTTDLQKSAQELARVLRPTGEMDLVFTGRHNGREFLGKTTPIFLKYMGPTLLLESAAMRKQLTKDAARALFEPVFGSDRVVVNESYDTYYDSLEGHWSWWVRAEGHFARMAPERKVSCDREIKQALSLLATDRGIPYTIHLVHVRVEAGDRHTE
jgi:ubiquinone/menaquinone biosynthesis C-methylase UbiE